MTAKQKRDKIKHILSKLDSQHRQVFKLMYSNGDLEKDISLVVDNIPAKRLDRALEQCKTTYHKIFKIIAGNT